MKKILFSILLAGLMLPLLSQGIHNLVIFTEEGERFQVVLNGVLQNAEPETNVMIRDLIAPSYKVKIIFEDQIPDLDKTIYFLEGSSQDTYSIKPNRKGEYVMRPQNSVPLEQAPPPPPNQVVHVYSTTPPPPSSVTVVETTTHHDQVPGTSVNVNANMSGMNINMNINDAHVSSSSTQPPIPVEPWWNRYTCCRATTDITAAPTPCPMPTSRWPNGRSRASLFPTAR